MLEYRLCVKYPSGHTTVQVPTPDLHLWKHPPFDAVIETVGDERSSPSHTRAHAHMHSQTHPHCTSLTGALQTDSYAHTRPALHVLVRCSWVWGRGAVDNKHNLLMQLYTIERRLRAGMGRSCGNGRTHATSWGSALQHLHRDWPPRRPHLHRDHAHTPGSPGSDVAIVSPIPVQMWRVSPSAAETAIKRESCESMGREGMGIRGHTSRWLAAPSQPQLPPSAHAAFTESFR